MVSIQNFKNDDAFFMVLFVGIATAAIEMLGGEEALMNCRKPEIMSDAAYVILTRDSRSRTGEFLIDDDVLKEVGVKDFSHYAWDPGKVMSSRFLHLKSLVVIWEIDCLEASPVLSFSVLFLMLYTWIF